MTRQRESRRCPRIATKGSEEGRPVCEIGQVGGRGTEIGGPPLKVALLPTVCRTLITKERGRQRPCRH